MRWFFVVFLNGVSPPKLLWSEASNALRPEDPSYTLLAWPGAFRARPPSLLPPHPLLSNKPLQYKWNNYSYKYIYIIYRKIRHFGRVTARLILSHSNQEEK